jgi:signal transduction histidine kinase
MDTTQREPEMRSSGAQPLRAVPGWLRLGTRWLAVMAAALGVALLWLLVAMHPTERDIAELALWLVVSGTLSIGAGAGAFWLADAANLRSVRLKFAIPSVLAALVIGLNTLVAAQMMFISVADAQMLIAFLIFGVCIALVLSNSVIESMTRSIRRVALGAQRMASGEYGVRLPETQLQHISEFADLAHGFNQMAQSVEEAFRTRDAAEANRRQVIAAISHDVRTPLTVMRAMLEAIDDGVVTDTEIVHRYHSAIRAELRHLSAMIDDLFEVSRIEAGAVRLEFAPLNIADIISDLLAATHEQADRAGVRLSGQVSPGVPALNADARQIYRILTNLVQNALRYTPADGTILVDARRAGARVQVDVIDTGAGIAAHDLPHVFEPAYRGEISRQRLIDAVGSDHAPGGTGLGLAIARGLVGAHGGTITAISPLPADLCHQHALSAAQSAAQSGTLVRIMLPVEAERVMKAEQPFQQTLAQPHSGEAGQPQGIAPTDAMAG